MPSEEVFGGFDDGDAADARMGSGTKKALSSGKKSGGSSKKSGAGGTKKSSGSTKTSGAGGTKKSSGSTKTSSGSRTGNQTSEYLEVGSKKSGRASSSSKTRSTNSPNSEVSINMPTIGSSSQRAQKSPRKSTKPKRRASIAEFKSGISSIFQSRITFWIFVLLDTVNYGLEMSIAVPLITGKPFKIMPDECDIYYGGDDDGGYGGGRRDRREYTGGSDESSSAIVKNRRQLLLFSFGYDDDDNRYPSPPPYRSPSPPPYRSPSPPPASSYGGSVSSAGGGVDDDDLDDTFNSPWGPLGDPVEGNTLGIGILMLCTCTLVFIMQTIMLRIGVHKLKTDPDAFDAKRQEEYEQTGDENKFDRRTSATGIYAMRFATAVFFTQTSTLYAIQRTLQTDILKPEDCRIFDITSGMFKAKLGFSIFLCFCACFFWGVEVYLMAKTLWGPNGDKIAHIMSGNAEKEAIYQTLGKNAGDEEPGKPMDQTDHPKLISVATLILTFCAIAGYCVYEGIMFAGMLMEDAHDTRAYFSLLGDAIWDYDAPGDADDYYDDDVVIVHSVFVLPIKWYVFLLALFLGLINLMDSADLALLGFGYRPWFADLQKGILYACKSDESKKIHDTLVANRKSGAY